MFLFVLDSDLGFRIFVIVELGLDNIFCLKKLRIFMFNFFKWKVLFKLNLVVVDILGFELLFEVNENVCKIIDIFNKLVEMLKIFG